MNFNSFLFVLGILWSTLIGEEPKGDGKTKIPPPKKVEVMGRWQNPQLHPETLQGISREQFILSFTRQSRISLEACLRQWQVSPYSLSLKAVLERSGRLKHIEALEVALPSCASAAINEMDFSPVAISMGGQSLLVYWQVTW